MATVLIGADICPIEANTPFFRAGDAQALFNDLLPELSAADLTIANLECPLIEKRTPIAKTGPTFGESPECIKGISKAIKLLCLANNHIMDHGAEGLASTMATCQKAGVPTVGAGRDLSEARRMFGLQTGKLRLGVLAMAEHEFSIATKDSPGACGLDVIDFVRNVNENRGKFDYLIVLVHGGDEFLVPSPRIKNTCQFLIESGANAVVVQHPHCLGGYEEYRGGHIVYGQGALVMDEALYRRAKTFHEGFLVKLLIADDATSKMELIPFRQSDPAPGARKLQGEDEKQFRKTLAQKAESILDDAFVEAQWLKFCDENKHGYVSALLGHHRILRRLNARGLFGKFIYNRRVKLTSRNIVSCETHREAIETILKRGLV